MKRTVALLLSLVLLCAALLSCAEEQPPEWTGKQPTVLPDPYETYEAARTYFVALAGVYAAETSTRVATGGAEVEIYRAFASDGQDRYSHIQMRNDVQQTESFICYKEGVAYLSAGGVRLRAMMTEEEYLTRLAGVEGVDLGLLSLRETDLMNVKMREEIGGYYFAVQVAADERQAPFLRAALGKNAYDMYEGGTPTSGVTCVLRFAKDGTPRAVSLTVNILYGGQEIEISSATAYKNFGSVQIPLPENAISYTLIPKDEMPEM
ncbi:MAG: hypothetical protein IJ012_02235 [Clostridia bacterium]|nr:hypothetical protein [Clostridia bacterium]